MKKCSKCKELKEASQFYKNRASKDGLQVYCIPCKKTQYSDNPEYYRHRALKIHRELQAIKRKAKDKPCMDCGIKYPYYVMDFDHREDKKFNIARCRSVGRNKLLKEMAKCDVVCANCHRERSFSSCSSIG